MLNTKRLADFSEDSVVNSASRRVTVIPQRFGVTIVEVLVVIGLIGVLIGLLVPAVQQSREAARRITCVGHQKQIGIALHQHLATFGRFPADNEDCLSWQVKLMPMLEQAELFEQIRVAAKGCWNPESTIALERIQGGIAIPVYRCPSDPDSGKGSTNYLGNSGPGFHRSENGTITLKAATDADFVDGLSNTAAVSECLVGLGKQPINHLPVPAESLAEWKSLFVPACRSEAESQRFPGAYMGLRILEPGYPSTVYAHILEPGANSCKGKGGGTATMISTPRSNHRSGVNLLMADGSVVFQSYTVDVRIWRQIGMRNDRLSFWED